MYPYFYYPNRNTPMYQQVPPYLQQPYSQNYRTYPTYFHRQQGVRGQATWTWGGEVTQCGIPWTTNEYMTASVGENAPYQCGQLLKIKNLTLLGEREIVVTVVDKVAGYPSNRINLHRKAFEALGANPVIGVLDIEITPSPELEEEKWGKYLLEVTQTAYPNYNVTEYNSISKTEIAADQIQETYEYVLQSPQENIKVHGTVIYNSNTNRIMSFDIKEV